MMSVQESRLTPTLRRNASRAFIGVLLDKLKFWYKDKLIKKKEPCQKEEKMVG